MIICFCSKSQEDRLRRKGGRGGRKNMTAISGTHFTNRNHTVKHHLQLPSSSRLLLEAQTQITPAKHVAGYHTDFSRAIVGGFKHLVAMIVCFCSKSQEDRLRRKGGRGGHKNMTAISGTHFTNRNHTVKHHLQLPSSSRLLLEAQTVFVTTM